MLLTTAQSLQPPDIVCLFELFMYVGVLPAGVPVYHVCARCLGDVKRALDPLRLRLSTIVNCHVDIGD